MVRRSGDVRLCRVDCLYTVDRLGVWLWLRLVLGRGDSRLWLGLGTLSVLGAMGLSGMGPGLGCGRRRSCVGAGWLGRL
ncbi:hypothetical protein D3C81_1763910 [compost metagenome]